MLIIFLRQLVLSTVNMVGMASTGTHFQNYSSQRDRITALLLIVIDIDNKFAVVIVVMIVTINRFSGSPEIGLAATTWSRRNCLYRQTKLVFSLIPV